MVPSRLVFLIQVIKVALLLSFLTHTVVSQPPRLRNNNNNKTNRNNSNNNSINEYNNNSNGTNNKNKNDNNNNNNKNSNNRRSTNDNNNNNKSYKPPLNAHDRNKTNPCPARLQYLSIAVNNENNNNNNNNNYNSNKYSIVANSYGEEKNTIGSHTDTCAHQRERRFAQNPPPNNLLWERALAEYTALHRRTVRNTLAQDLARTLGNREDLAQGEKYILLDLNASGLGNRMNTMLSGFLLALLTRRVLLVHTPESDFDVSSIFCQPFAGSDWLWPRELSIAETLAKGHFKSATIAGSASDHYASMIDNPSSIEDKQILYLPLAEMYHIPLFFRNKDYFAKLKQWFPHNAVGTALARFLFHPVDDIWAEIVRTYIAMRGDDLQAFTLGVQMRNNGLDNEWNCFEEISQNLPRNRSVHVFVASMTGFQQIYARHSSRMISAHTGECMITNEWKFLQRFQEGSERHDNTQTARALHDIWVLSMLDESIVSPRSTFGYMAMLLAGRRFLFPHSPLHPPCDYKNLRDHRSKKKHNNNHMNDLFSSLIIGDNHNINSSGTKCFRAISYEACFHRSLFFSSSPLRSFHETNNNSDHLTESMLWLPCEDTCAVNGFGDIDGWKLITWG